VIFFITVVSKNEKRLIYLSIGWYKAITDNDRQISIVILNLNLETSYGVYSNANVSVYEGKYVHRVLLEEF